LAYVEDLLHTAEEQPTSDWFNRLEAFHIELRKKSGDRLKPSLQDILDQVREEPTDEQLGRS
jgi:hypothetical protein